MSRDTAEAALAPTMVRGALIVYAESLEARIAAGEQSPELVAEAQAARARALELERA